MPDLSKSTNKIYGEAAFEVLAKAQELERKGKHILHFEIGEPDMETPKNISYAGIKAIKNKKATTTAVNPVLPPASIPVADSINTPHVVVPNKAPAAVASASHSIGFSISGNSPFSSSKFAL